MEEKILEILERNFTDSIEFDRNKATEELLLLHNVVWQGEQFTPKQLWRMAQKYNADDFIQMVKEIEG